MKLLFFLAVATTYYTETHGAPKILDRAQSLQIIEEIKTMTATIPIPLDASQIDYVYRDVLSDTEVSYTTIGSECTYILHKKLVDYRKLTISCARLPEPFVITNVVREFRAKRKVSEDRGGIIYFGDVARDPRPSDSSHLQLTSVDASEVEVVRSKILEALVLLGHKQGVKLVLAAISDVQKSTEYGNRYFVKAEFILHPLQYRICNVELSDQAWSSTGSDILIRCDDNRDYRIEKD